MEPVLIHIVCLLPTTPDEAKLVLQQTVKLDSIQSPEFYDCIFVPGGHGPVYDLAASELLADILTKAAAAGGNTSWSSGSSTSW